jgi:hypothetical protein
LKVDHALGDSCDNSYHKGEQPYSCDAIYYTMDMAVLLRASDALIFSEKACVSEVLPPWSGN